MRCLGFEQLRKLGWLIAVGAAFPEEVNHSGDAGIGVPPLIQQPVARVTGKSNEYKLDWNSVYGNTGAQCRG